MGQGSLEIPKRTRREITRDLDIARPGIQCRSVLALLGRLWVLDDDMFSWLSECTTSLRARIERHVFRNPGDWTTEELFEQLGAFEATDARFARFLEGLVSADIVPDESAQRHIVTPSTRICVPWEPSCVRPGRRWLPGVQRCLDSRGT